MGLLRRRSSTHKSGGHASVRHRDTTRQDFAYLIVIDFESTCWRDKKNPHQEIIEFPAVVLNTSTGSIESEFHTYVLPEENPQLSEFCTELTGITQDQVESGIPLRLCLHRFDRWLKTLETDKHLTYNTRQDIDQKLCTFVTWSDWDLSLCLHYECRRKQLLKPAVLNSWIDLRATYKNFYQRKPNGLLGALQDVGIQFSGRQHSGLDDARNTASLAWRMIRDGCIMNITRTMQGTQQLKRKATGQLAEQPTLNKPTKLKSNCHSNSQTSGCLLPVGTKIPNRTDLATSKPVVEQRVPLGLSSSHTHQGLVSKTMGHSEVAIPKNEQFTVWEDPPTSQSVSASSKSSIITKVTHALHTSSNNVIQGQNTTPSLGLEKKDCSNQYPMNNVKDHMSGKSIDSRYTMLRGRPGCLSTPNRQPDQRRDATLQRSDAFLRDTSPIFKTPTDVLRRHKMKTPPSSEFKTPDRVRTHSCNMKTPDLTLPRCNSATSGGVVHTACPSPNYYLPTPHSTVPACQITPSSDFVVRSGCRMASESKTSRTPIPAGKITPPMCQCGRRSKKRTVLSPGPNQGRPFYSCPTGRRSSSAAGWSSADSGAKKGCAFFKWESAVLNEKRPSAPSPTTYQSSNGRNAPPSLTDTSTSTKIIPSTVKRLGVGMRTSIRH